MEDSMKIIKKAFWPLLIVLFAVNTYAQRSFVYTNNGTTPFNTISAFSVEPDGHLAPIPGSPFAAGAFGFVSGAEASPQTTIVGKFLYASNANDIGAYSIDPNSGGLTPVAGSPFPIGAVPQRVSLAATPDGRLLFGGYSISRSIHGFSIGANGGLTEISRFDFPPDSTPVSVAASPNGRLLAVMGRRGLGPFPVGAIWMLTINQNGTLTLVPGSPFADGTPDTGCCTGGEPAGGQFNRTSNLLFVSEATFGSATVDVFNVASNGVLTPIPGSPFKYGLFFGGGENSRYVLLSQDEKTLFVSNQSTSSITALTVAPNGSLTPVPGSPFSEGPPRFGSPMEMATDRDGAFLFAANTGLTNFAGNFLNTVSVFRITGNGALSLVDGFSTGTCCGLASVVVYPAKPLFDLCIQDDSSGILLKVNSSTGDYQFANCSGLTISGMGGIIKRGSIITLNSSAAGHRISARIDISANKATASLQLFSPAMTFTITDRNITNNACSCTAN